VKGGWLGGSRRRRGKAEGDGCCDESTIYVCMKTAWLPKVWKVKGDRGGGIRRVTGVLWLKYNMCIWEHHNETLVQLIHAKNILKTELRNGYCSWKDSYVHTTSLIWNMAENQMVNDEYMILVNDQNPSLSNIMIKFALGKVNPWLDVF
jgi:hypothetical protein